MTIWEVVVKDPEPNLCLQDIEKGLMKQDAEKDARKASTNQPAAVAQNLLLNEANATRRRGRMMLPAPQVNLRKTSLSCDKQLATNV